MKKSKIIDLSKVTISKRVYDAWMSKTGEVVKDLNKVYADLKPSDLGDEMFEIKPDGTGVIFLAVRDIVVRMEIPESDYSLVAWN